MIKKAIITGGLVLSSVACFSQTHADYQNSLDKNNRNAMVLGGVTAGVTYTGLRLVAPKMKKHWVLLSSIGAATLVSFGKEKYDQNNDIMCQGEFQMDNFTNGVLGGVVVGGTFYLVDVIAFTKGLRLNRKPTYFKK